jgi:hypothetical protein
LLTKKLIVLEDGMGVSRCRRTTIEVSYKIEAPPGMRSFWLGTDLILFQDYSPSRRRLLEWLLGLTSSREEVNETPSGSTSRKPLKLLALAKEPET